MKMFLILLGLFLPSVVRCAENTLDLNIIPVCATLNNVKRTFVNVWHIYNEFKTNGQLWIPVAIGTCSGNGIDCTNLNPVCALSNKNIFKTFPNQCSLEAEQNATATVWKIVFNGTCATSLEMLTPSQLQAPASYETPLQATPRYSNQEAQSSSNCHQDSVPLKPHLWPSYDTSKYYSQEPQNSGNCNQDTTPNPAMASSSPPQCSSSYTTSAPSAYGQCNERPQPLSNSNQVLALNPAMPVPSESYSSTPCDDLPKSPSQHYKQRSQPPANYKKCTASYPAKTTPLQAQSSSAYDAEPPITPKYYDQYSQSPCIYSQSSAANLAISSVASSFGQYNQSAESVPCSNTKTFISPVLSSQNCKPLNSQTSNDIFVASDYYSHAPKNSYDNKFNSNLSNSNEYNSINEMIEHAIKSNQNLDSNNERHNGVVYQGPYQYEPNYRHINFDDYNFLPAENLAPAPAINLEKYHAYNNNLFDKLLWQLQDKASDNYNSD